MYELSDEEKRRIREEEEAAAERERYRAFIGQQTRSHAERDEGRVFAWWEKLGLAVLTLWILAGVGAMTVDHFRSERLRSRVSAQPLDRQALERKAAHAEQLRKFHDAARSGRIGGDAGNWVETIDQIRESIGPADPVDEKEGR